MLFCLPASTFKEQSVTGDVAASLSRVVTGDLTRNSTLVFIVRHANTIGSDLLSVPILPSYLYWSILLIPRSVWPSKPYTAVVQFNHDYNVYVSGLYQSEEDIFSGYQFGFIDEAMLNLGWLGLIIVGVLGNRAAWADNNSHHPYLTRVALPFAFGLGTVTAFHSVLMAVGPFIACMLIVDLSSRAIKKRSGEVQKVMLESMEHHT